MSNTELPVVIIGAGHAGMQIAANLRLKHWEHGIILIDADAHMPYERPPLSKEVLKAADGENVDFPLRSAAFFEKNEIELRLGKNVQSIDREAKTVTLSDGEAIAYSKLILATGARARTLNIPGAELDGIFYLRTKDESLALKQELKNPDMQRVVIVGAGYIGMEVAAAARAAGLDVTVIEFMDRVMSRVTSPVVSAFFTELHEAQGTKFVFGEAVSEIHGSGRVQEVLTMSGKTFAADLLVIGVGIIPNDEIAETADLPHENGIVIDEFCRTEDPDVYAAGDVAVFESAYTPGKIRLECIQNAVNHAAIIAEHITQGTRPEHEEVPWFWTVQHGIRLQTAGLWNPNDEIVIRRFEKENSFSVLYLRDGKLAAIDTIAALSDFTPAKKIITHGWDIDIELARDPQVKLSNVVLAQEVAV